MAFLSMAALVPKKFGVFSMPCWLVYCGCGVLRKGWSGSDGTSVGHFWHVSAIHIQAASN